MDRSHHHLAADSSDINNDSPSHHRPSSLPPTAYLHNDWLPPQVYYSFRRLSTKHEHITLCRTLFFMVRSPRRLRADSLSPTIASNYNIVSYRCDITGITVSADCLQNINTSLCVARCSSWSGHLDV
ncbi:hypothetical protein J6590_022420 [Homalodisca vitripennis]|nr:hypothetical protein J6590_022420 [Homalodisca vitripennis]